MTKFNEWKQTVNRQLVACFGLSSDDLPDATWYDYFEDELSPFDAIECAIDDAWWDMGDMWTIWDEYLSLREAV